MRNAKRLRKAPHNRLEGSLAFIKNQGWSKGLSVSSECLLSHLLIAMIAFEKALLQERKLKRSIPSDEIANQFFKALRRIEKVLSKGKRR